MRLINCTTLDLEEFNGQDIPSYAILSHTWEDEEITWADYLQGPSPKKGWVKIHQACVLALQHDLEYVWIDTCCIDKSSSAELIEAINSMYTWYANSEICFAHLTDFHHLRPSAQNSMRGCRWFERGWTLQELIAASAVHFYNSSWQYVGSKLDHCHQIVEITGIDEAVLSRAGEDLQLFLDLIPVCKKMSWAANRHTTRPEDMAYCLLGLFRIHMPMLYGEGAEAFIRLQEEIIKKCNDLSILAWQSTRHTMPWDCTGILASSPQEFSNSRDIVRSQDLIYNPEFTMTNKGLRITAPLSESRSSGFEPILILSLHCHREDRPEEALGIYLRNVGGRVYARVRPNSFPVEAASARSDEKSIFLSKEYSIRNPENMALVQSRHFRFSIDRGSSDLIEHVSSFPEERWDKNFGFRARDMTNFVGINTYRIRWEETITFVVACGFAPNVDPWVCVSQEGSENEVWSAANSNDVALVGGLGPMHSNRNLWIRTSYWGVKICIHVHDGEFHGESGVYEVVVDASTKKRRTRARSPSVDRLPAQEDMMLLEYPTPV